MADEEIDELIEEPGTPDEEDLEDDSMPFSLEDEGEIDDDDEDDLGEDGGEIDLEVALAIGDDEDNDVSPLDEDDDEDEDDVPVREGEFVCNGCYMVFRVTAMADTKARLCRDCA